MADKKESLEQLAAGFIGFSGMALPSLADIGQVFQAVTIIFSFFFIVVPTGIWACCRAVKSIRGLRQGGLK